MNLCDICKEKDDRSYIILLTDKKSKVEMAICYECDKEWWPKIKRQPGKDKMTNEKRLMDLGLDDKGFKVIAKD